VISGATLPNPVTLQRDCPLAFAFCALGRSPIVTDFPGRSEFWRSRSRASRAKVLHAEATNLSLHSASSCP
jgi:hypothetical protein